MHESFPLDLLDAGQCGAVAALLGEPGAVHRLEELGLRRGAEIEMIRPGSPCIVRLGGQRLCLRPDDSVHVLVRLGAVA